jgi:hypothetical protein
VPSDPEIDWTLLSSDGRELEQLTRDLMGALGYRAAWSGYGPDGGRDLIAMEPGAPDFGGFSRKWLVSCKHNAVGGQAVSYSDVGDVPGRLSQHGCQGFLLVCTTHPSSGLIDAFRSWQDNTPYVFHYWDDPTLRILLRRPEASFVIGVYFQKSAPAVADNDAIPDFRELKSDETARDALFYIQGATIGFYFEAWGSDGRDDGLAHYREFEVAWRHLAADLPHLQWAVRGVLYSDAHGTLGRYTWRVDVAPRSAGHELNPEVLNNRLSTVLGYRLGGYHDFLFHVRREPLAPMTSRAPEEVELEPFAIWDYTPRADRRECAAEHQRRHHSVALASPPPRDHQHDRVVQPARERREQAHPGVILVGADA